MSDDLKISASRVIPASPEEIFDLLTDPTKHPVLDGSGSVQAPLPGNPDRLEAGSKFSMSMRLGVPYRIRNTVVEYEPNRRIAWAHFGGHRWRFELEPVEGGTRVTETFDMSTSKAPWLLKRMPLVRRHPENIARTLENLERWFTGSGSSGEAGADGPAEPAGS